MSSSFEEHYHGAGHGFDPLISSPLDNTTTDNSQAEDAAEHIDHGNKSSDSSPKKKKRKTYPRKPSLMCKVEGCTFKARTVSEGVCARHGTQEKFRCSHDGCTNLAQKNGVCQRHGARPKRCSIEGCTNESLKRGVCWKHGAKKHCSVEGCTNLALRKGVCTTHGAKPKPCKVEGCTNQSKRNGVCRRHGAAYIQCNIEGCTKRVGRGGLCRQHGAYDRPGAPPPPQWRKKCSVDGCTSFARSKGVCVNHGAKNSVRKPCSVEGCTNQSRAGGLCKGHDMTKRCSHEGCESVSHKAGLCWKHGGKDKCKTCSHDGCANLSVRFGVCVRHGAPLKNKTLCRHDGCMHQSVRSGLCVRHGAPVKKCAFGGCTNQALKANLCWRHGANHIIYGTKPVPLECKHEGCNKWAQTGEFCLTHIVLPAQEENDDDVEEDVSLDGENVLELPSPTFDASNDADEDVTLAELEQMITHRGDKEIKDNDNINVSNDVDKDVPPHDENVPELPPPTAGVSNVDADVMLAEPDEVPTKGEEETETNNNGEKETQNSDNVDDNNAVDVGAKLHHENGPKLPPLSEADASGVDEDVILAGPEQVPTKGKKDTKINSNADDENNGNSSQIGNRVIEQESKGSNNENNKFDDPKSSNNHLAKQGLLGTGAISEGRNPFKIIVIPPAPSGKRTRIGLRVEFSDRYNGAKINAIHSSCTFKDEIRLGDRIITNCGKEVQKNADLQIKGSDGARHFGIASISSVEEAAAKCKHEGCEDMAKKEGLCSKHYIPKCNFEGCTKRARCKGGFCKRHRGGVENIIRSSSKRKKADGDGSSAEESKRPKKTYKYECKHEGCTKWGCNGGYCVAHGGTKSNVKHNCSHEGCNKGGWMNGFCGQHARLLGKGPKSSICKIEGCTRWVQSKGLCIAHGGRRPNTKLCKHPECKDVPYKYGHCKVHLGRQICTVAGCSNFAHLRAKISVCQKHGGYIRICKVEGCSNQEAKGGVCDRHGARRNNKCNKDGCTSWSYRGGYCKKHKTEQESLQQQQQQQGGVLPQYNIGFIEDQGEECCKPCGGTVPV